MTPTANLDLVRSIYAAWEHGDFSSADWADPEIEFVMIDGPFPGKWQGLTGMAEAWREMLNAWEAYRVETPTYRTLDDERVLVLSRQTGHGKTSGLDLGRMQTENATVFRVRKCKVVRLVVYWDGEKAVADLSLAPDTGS